MIKFKAYASALEWSTDDALDVYWPSHRLLRHGSAEWELESDVFWAAMAFGNYELATKEDEEDE